MNHLAPVSLREILFCSTVRVYFKTLNNAGDAYVMIGLIIDGYKSLLNLKLLFFVISNFYFCFLDRMRFLTYFRLVKLLKRQTLLLLLLLSDNKFVNLRFIVVVVVPFVHK